MNERGKRAAGAANSFRSPRDEKNRRFVSYESKGAKKLNISFAPLEKI